MKFTRHSNLILLAGASAIALSSAPAVTAQEEAAAESRRVMDAVVVTTQKNQRAFRTFQSLFRPSTKKRLRICNLQVAAIW